MGTCRLGKVSKYLNSGRWLNFRSIWIHYRFISFHISFFILFSNANEPGTIEPEINCLGTYWLIIEGMDSQFSSPLNHLLLQSTEYSSTAREPWNNE